MLADCRDHECGNVCEFAGRIVDAISRPVEVDGVVVPLTASVGVALYPDHASDATELMERSDIALYEAKRSGRGRFGVFSQSMQSRLDTARALELEMERAIREDQFEVWFQPIQDIDSGGILGYEALARWRHPSLGIVTPDRFIPVAEQNGAIVDIGKAVLEKACRAAAEWDPRLTVAVNLSAVEFRRPDELVERIKQTLHRTGLDPTRLVVEITESLMLEDSPLTRAAVKQLSDYGVRFSSTISAPAIPRSPISRIIRSPRSKSTASSSSASTRPVSSAIVASVCVLAERTRMEIIAEGVENRVQEIALRRLGVKHAQGFLYGRPRPILLTAPTTTTARRRRGLKALGAEREFRLTPQLTHLYERRFAFGRRACLTPAPFLVSRRLTSTKWTIHQTPISASALIRRNGAARLGEIHTLAWQDKNPGVHAGRHRGTVKAMYPHEVRALGADIVLCNTYHLMLRPAPSASRRSAACTSS